MCTQPSVVQEATPFHPMPLIRTARTSPGLVCLTDKRCCWTGFPCVRQKQYLELQEGTVIKAFIDAGIGKSLCLRRCEMNISPSPGAFTAVFIKSQVVFSDFSRPSFSIFLPWLFHEAHSSSETCLPSPPPPPDGLSFYERVVREGDPQGVKTTELCCLSCLS